jgi:hypothetical protein
MLVIANAMSTATPLSTRVHFRQSAIRSRITSSQRALLHKENWSVSRRLLIKPGKAR